MTALAPAPAAVRAVASGRRRRAARRRALVGTLAALVVAGFAVTLMVGQTFYPPGDVLRVVFGEQVPGASFTVGRLRLPRVVLAVAAGFAFGLGGVTFQTLLRNPLASPDIIGISAGASAAASIAIVVFSLGGTQVSVFAIVSALGVALLMYVLAFRDGVVGTRLILIGIGVAAMGEAVTSYVLSRAGEWDLQEATRWLTGSLNGTTWEQVVPTVAALAVLTPALLFLARDLSALRLGDDTASALGVRVERTRIAVIVAATGLIAFATAAAGPIAFVAFLSGPIAARLIGTGGSPLLPAGLVGALLVLTGDFIGQFAFDTRYPVGVVTGVLGAPYLVYLIVRTHRAGGSL
ncbi:iron chelate uptake ABC transporter family permease subunit [Actinomadura sp. NAK00032]|uniref:FecCD family ABC transporter permease n=1 Tax=Actinomadura sp. NAK00032 TaxID=2742128 RepID=UPI001591B140|nr:iron chelate uptake ABC transporter family permease subunit [Actinomadura sp. NAK00032]QKW38241.1 iron chelate uptake ABC transporter family permease subunit [Actinomadura sp. NAK00032]